MPRWVEEHADVVPWLVLRHGRSQGNSLSHGRIEVTDLEVEMHHRTLGLVYRRPDRGLVAGRFLEHDVNGTLGGSENDGSRLFVTNRPVQQFGIERRQREGVGRFNSASPPHALHPGAHAPSVSQVETAGSYGASAMTHYAN